jgi:hypothetical protein
LASEISVVVPARINICNLVGIVDQEAAEPSVDKNLPLFPD